MKLFTALFFVTSFSVAAQAPEVPHKMEFAGMTLTIRDDARREIQKDVDALTQSPRHYNLKAERAKTYFPIIEKVFAEEQVPDDFKYLALQESALIADAVSSSNAVGFWQFKDFTAIEMGLRVDKDVDERLNIVASSRAAARYFKKNNALLNNWLYALQAYQMGAGGVMRSEDQSHSGKTHMEITGKTYWYVKKYLAHKVAYEPGVSGRGLTQVMAYEANTGKTLQQFAKEISVDEEELLNFNKWAKAGVIPTDRMYSVIIPVKGDHASITLPAPKTDPIVQSKNISSASALASTRKKINGIWAMQSNNGETSIQFAERAGVELGKFLRYNDLASGQPLEPGQYYFLGKKRGRAKENFHKVSPGENLWLISQMYGVQIKKLRKFNRLASHEDVAAGHMLWLASTRPKTDEVSARVENAVAVNQKEPFTWTEQSPKSETLVETKSPEVIVSPVVTQATDTAVIASVDSGTIISQQEVKPEAVPVESTPQESVTKIEITEQAVVPVVKPDSHTVQVKETLYAIAKMYDVGVMDLVKWNNLDLQQGIKPGQIISLKDPGSVTQVKEAVTATTSKSRQPVVHEVKSSDTLYSIARQYGVTIKEIMDWNEKKDFSLSVGEKLKINNP
jgi:membrane-bound lytic murein transglycosylase D